MEQHKLALEAWGTAFGREHPMVAAVRNNLGNSLQTAGRADEAVEQLERALEIRRVVLPAGHLDIGGSLNNLGSLHYHNEAYARALPLFEEARDVFADALGKDHHYVALALENIAATHLHLGHLEPSERAIERSVEIVQAKFGSQHPRTASSVRWKGRLRQAQGRHDEAIALLLEAVAGWGASQADPYQGALIQLDLADALWQVPERRPEAPVHAIAALSQLEAAGPRARKDALRARSRLKKMLRLSN